MNTHNAAKAQSFTTFTRIKIYDQKTHISSEAEKLPDKYKDKWDWNKSMKETLIPCKICKVIWQNMLHLDTLHHTKKHKQRKQLKL